jgi:hypothetical protein
MFRDFLAGDVVQLALQPSQHVTLGVTRPVLSYEDGEELAEGGPAWTAIGRDGRILACIGAKYLWPPHDEFGGHAVAWAMLAADLGAAHLAVSRFARDRIADVAADRLEAIVRADVAAEARWPELLGMRLVARLEKWGPDAAPHLLFERIR